MTTMEQHKLEQTLSAAFCGGERRRRELRLSQEEAALLPAILPHASIVPLGEDGGEKCWYEISLISAPA